MDISVTRTVDVDIRKQVRTHITGFRQHNTSYLYVNLKDKGKVADLSGVHTIIRSFARPDGVIISHSCSWEGSKVFVPLEEEVDVAGRGGLTLHLYSENGQLSTFGIFLYIQSVVEETVTDAPTVLTVNRLIMEMETVREEVGSAIGDVETAEEEALAARIAAELAKEGALEAKNEVLAVKGDITTVTTDVNALKTKTDTTQTGLTALTTEVGGIKTSVASVNTELMSTKNQMTSITGELETVKEDVAKAVQVRKVVVKKDTTFQLNAEYPNDECTITQTGNTLVIRFTERIVGEQPSPIASLLTRDGGYPYLLKCVESSNQEVHIQFYRIGTFAFEAEALDQIAEGIEIAISLIG